MKLTINTLAQFRVLDALDAADEVLNDSVLVTWRAANDLPQLRGLYKVLVLDLTGVGCDVSRPFLVLGVQSQRSGAHSFLVLVELGGLDGGANVVRVSAVVVVKSHGSVALEGAIDLHLCGIGRELLVGHTETVAGCIRVREESCLEHLKPLVLVYRKRVIRAYLDQQTQRILEPSWMARTQLARCRQSSFAAAPVSNCNTP